MGSMTEVVRAVHAENFGSQMNGWDEVDTSGLSVSSGSARWTSENSNIDLGPELVRLNNPGGRIKVNAQAGRGVLRAHIALTATLPKGFQNSKIHVNGPEGFDGFTLDVTSPTQIITIGSVQPGLFHSKNSNQQDLYRLRDVLYRGSFTLQVNLQGHARVHQLSSASQIPGRELQSKGNFGVVQGECVYKIHYD